MQRPSQNIITSKLLECAKKDFLQNGYQGISLKDICRHAGITTGALYHRFHGKEDLYKTVVEPASEKFLEMLSVSPLDTISLIMPEPCLVFIYSHLNEFKLIVQCKCTPFYREFCDTAEEIIYQRLMNANENYAEDICRLLSKAYLTSLFEIVRCDYDFETAKKCICILETFFALQETPC